MIKCLQQPLQFDWSQRMLIYLFPMLPVSVWIPICLLMPLGNLQIMWYTLPTRAWAHILATSVSWHMQSNTYCATWSI